METTVWNRPLFTENSPKTVKGESLGYLTLILYLAPAETASATMLDPYTANAMGPMNVCPYSTPGCREVCLNTAGRGRFANIQETRRAKTRAFFEDRNRFMAKMEDEIAKGLKRAKALGLTLAVRCNGTSDLPFLTVTMARLFPDVQFYDYTKAPYLHDVRRKLPNVHLTYSWGETHQNQETGIQTLLAGGNVAVVFDTGKGDDLPKRWKGFRVIDGDTHDLRFLDPKARKGCHGVVVGLRAKGKAKHDTSGFVVKL